MSEGIERALIRSPKRVLGPRPEESEWFTEEELEVTKIASGYLTYEELRNRPKQKREILTTRTYQYWAPFNYPNIKVELGRKDWGEFNPDGVELDIPPYGAITITEEEPIIGVTVIGSACISPGYVILEAEPVEWKYPRTGVKMLATNLWGQHVNILPWKLGVDESEYHIFPGMSSANFEIPESKKVTIKGGSQAVPGATDPKCGDAHYCFRIIRVTVKV